MRILDNMESCYGCEACRNACPTGAISMEKNSEGFLEPVIDEEKCIDCGKCRKVCPSINCQYPNSPEPDILAFSAEEKVLYNSSSGGIFTFLAEHILKAGGYVVGAAYDSEFCVHHIIIHSMDELDKIRRSKYLQSSTSDTFQKTKELLEEGNTVLYSGCPCQIAGLSRFLGRGYDRLYTVDVICHGVPSPGLFQEHLQNSFGGTDQIDDVEFRSREGWASLFRVKLKDGKVRTLYNNNSVYMQSFLQNINLRSSCFQCQYSKLPRQGDITIGDLWAAGNLNLSFEYRKGVSVILLNNEKGTAFFHEALSGSEYQFHVQELYRKGSDKNCEKRFLNGNIFSPSVNSSGIRRRQEFFENYSEMKFESAVHATLHKFDVGLILYMSENFGSIATNYALYRAISDMGKKTAVLESWGWRLGNNALKFARSYMKLTGGFLELENGQEANQCFETFVIGSDVAWDWTYDPLKMILQFRMMGFADENKRMISYAPSFGARKGVKDISEEARMLGTYFLKRFDAISVREDYGVDMCRDIFGIEAKQVLDPVFLCDRRVWEELSDNSQLKFEEEYLLAYILDPTPDKRQVLLEAATNTGKKLVVILDQGYNKEASKKALNMDDKVVQPEFVDWLAYFRHASYVITDSMHGTCFAIMFGRKFVSIKNRSKGRFDSLANMIGCPWLFFDDSKMLLGKANIFAEIDYDAVYERMEPKRMESKQWLRSALDMEVKHKSGSESTNIMLQLYKVLKENKDSLNRIKTEYAYDEKQKQETAAQVKAGKTWLDTVFSRNNIISRGSKLRGISNTREYFSILKSDSRYVAVFSCNNECSVKWKSFLEVIGLPLRADLSWRNSYVAVIDGGVVKIDEKSNKELNIDYEFVVGHPSYSVEYLDSKLKVCCEPLKNCKIKIKSKGFVSAGMFRSEIIVDNIDYSINKTGINIVVIDKETGEVADSININTYSDSNLKINRA